VYDSQPKAKDQHKRNNHTDEGQEKLQVSGIIWESLF
jgi:hypothetical protein